MWRNFTDAQLELLAAERKTKLIDKYYEDHIPKKVDQNKSKKKAEKEESEDEKSENSEEEEEKEQSNESDEEEAPRPRDRVIKERSVSINLNAPASEISLELVDSMDIQVDFGQSSGAQSTQPPLASNEVEKEMDLSFLQDVWKWSEQNASKEVRPTVFKMADTPTKPKKEVSDSEDEEEDEEDDDDENEKGMKEKEDDCYIDESKIVIEPQQTNISVAYPGYSAWGKSTTLHLLANTESLLKQVMNKYPKQVKEVVNEQNVLGDTVLLQCLDSKYVDLVSRLIGDFNASINVHYEYINTNYPIHYITQMKNITLLKQIIPLCVKQKLVDVENEYGGSALHMACNQRWKKGVILLLKNGANVNMTDKKMRTPLHLAVYGANVGVNASFDIEEILLNRGANINALDKKLRSPLHYGFKRTIATFDPIEIVTGLCADKKLKIDEGDSNGNTPLCMAAMKGATISSLYLLQRGANLEKENNHKNTPLSLAILKDHPGYAVTLLQKGANVSHPIYLAQTSDTTHWIGRNSFYFIYLFFFFFTF